eukprot:2869000-Prymnesium_polylepis.1
MRGLIGSRRVCAVHVARRSARACVATLVHVYTYRAVGAGHTHISRTCGQRPLTRSTMVCPPTRTPDSNVWISMQNSLGTTHETNGWIP